MTKNVLKQPVSVRFSRGDGSVKATEWLQKMRRRLHLSVRFSRGGGARATGGGVGWNKFGVFVENFNKS